MKFSVKIILCIFGLCFISFLDLFYRSHLNINQHRSMNNINGIKSEDINNFNQINILDQLFIECLLSAIANLNKQLDVLYNKKSGLDEVMTEIQINLRYIFNHKMIIYS